jgi:hypothetical protein
MSSPIPLAASLMRTCASAAEYCALMTSFCVRNDSTFACSVRHDVLQLALDRRLAGQRLAREILAVRLQRVARLAVELVDLLLHARVLELEALLRRRDIGDAALDVLELFELLLVRVVERLVRVLRAVERLGRLRAEDEHEAGPQAGHSGVSSGRISVG